MAKLQQGSVVWGDLAGPVGHRPVVILTRDSAIGRLNGITVAPITRTIRHAKTEVVLEPIDGVPEICVISLDNIITVPRVSLGSVIAILGRDRMQQVFGGIRAAFDMP